MGKIHILQMDWFAQQMAENMDSKWILNVALQFKKDQNKLGTHQRNWRTGFRINCHRLTTNLKPACDVLPPTDSTLNTKQNGKWFLFHHLQNSLLSLSFLSLALSLWQKECNSNRGEEVNNALHPAAASGACSITHTRAHTHTHTLILGLRACSRSLQGREVDEHTRWFTVKTETPLESFNCYTRQFIISLFTNITTNTFHFSKKGPLCDLKTNMHWHVCHMI